MSLETVLALAAAFTPVVLFVVYSNRLDKTEEGMKIAYSEINKRTGRLLNTNHTTTRQRVSRVRWKHRKVDELMINRFGAERVNEFYEKHNVAEQRQRDFEYVRKVP